LLLCWLLSLKTLTKKRREKTKIKNETGEAGAEEEAAKTGWGIFALFLDVAAGPTTFRPSLCHG